MVYNLCVEKKRKKLYVQGNLNVKKGCEQCAGRIFFKTQIGRNVKIILFCGKKITVCVFL